MTEPATVVATGYRFLELGDLDDLRDRIEAAADAAQLLGTLLLAEEGINLTVAGPAAGIDAFESALAGLLGVPDFALRRSPATRPRPFRRLKVRIRPEIVSLGQGSVPVATRTGTPVAPEDWNAVLEDPDIPVIDVRNDYEYMAGHFEGAVDPATDSFREFPAWVASHLDPDRHPRVAMYCTGGIRCEKASAWMRERGFREVLQLQGGILAYLEQVSATDSRWQGDCFVFDDRVALRQGLSPSTLEVCHGCRRPLTDEDRSSPDYEAGVCCPACAPGLDPAERAGRRERRRQVELAERRGGQHLAPQAHQGAGRALAEGEDPA